MTSKRKPPRFPKGSKWAGRFMPKGEKQTVDTERAAQKQQKSPRANLGARARFVKRPAKRKSKAERELDQKQTKKEIKDRRKRESRRGFKKAAERVLDTLAKAERLQRKQQVPPDETGGNKYANWRRWTFHGNEGETAVRWLLRLLDREKPKPKVIAHVAVGRGREEQSSGTRYDTPRGILMWLSIVKQRPSAQQIFERANNGETLRWEVETFEAK